MEREWSGVGNDGPWETGGLGAVSRVSFPEAEYVQVPAQARAAARPERAGAERA